MTQKIAIETLAYIESIVENLNNEDSNILALYNIKQETKKFIAKNNLALLEEAELGKNQLFYLNIMRSYEWISAKDLSERLREAHTHITRHLNALTNKGYLKTSEFEGTTYYKVKAGI